MTYVQTLNGGYVMKYELDFGPDVYEGPENVQVLVGSPREGFILF